MSSTRCGHYARLLTGALCAFALLAGPASAQQTENRRVQLRITQQDIKEPVRLQNVSINTDITGQLAQTTIDMVFYNPNNRVLEGQLQFPLLDGQSISGFALEMEDGKLRQAVPVEKDKGRIAFEAVTRQQIDPALLQQTQGNNYQLRVYPLNPQKTRRVQLRYTERLSESDGKLLYRLPLTYGDKLATLKLSMRINGAAAAPQVQSGPAGAFQFNQRGGSYQAELTRNDFAGNGIIQIAIPSASSAQTSVQTVDGKTYFYTHIPASGLENLSIDSTRHEPRSVTLLWDSSASGAKRNHQRELALLDAWFSQLGNVSVSLQRVRDVAEPSKTYTVRNGNWQALRNELEQTVYDGATNLGAFNLKGNSDAWLLFSDGLNTYGNQRFNPQNILLYSVVSSASADNQSLRALAEQNGGRLIDLNSQTPQQAVNSLLDRAPRLLSMQSNGARDLVSASNVVDADGLTIAGILTEPKTSLRLTILATDGSRRDINVPIDNQHQSTLPAAEWARLKIQRLSADYQLNKGEIRRLGKTFGLVTPETSLIVLDRVEDYVRYEITPPPELLKDYEQRRAAQATQARTATRNHLDQLAEQWKAREKWWATKYPKGAPPQPKQVVKPTAPGIGGGHARDQRIVSEGAVSAAAPAVAESIELADYAAAPMMERRTAPIAAAKSAGTSSSNQRQAAAPTASIKLQAWKPNEPYMQRLNSAAPGDLYRIYLDERASYADSPSFYLDVADLLLAKGQTALGLRVLSNLAEMDLENRQILRILGYRLIQAKQPQLAVTVFEKVLDMAREEPQSYRDLGLAHAENGQNQQAIDNLYQVVEKPWDARHRDIAITALSELNAIVATSKQKLNTSAMDPRLLKNLPLDLRVVLSWDTDNTDIDLWVTDPNNERAYYGHKLSYQGGLMSMDITQGYGPETYSLRTAKRGKYKVEINFYGERQQLYTGATTIQVNFVTGFGTSKQKSQLVTMRLKEKGSGIFVGEFEVR